ncbi:MAG: GlmL-related ornithine degradation protein [Bacillota bacterium]
MRVDALVAEIGSTTTVVSAFSLGSSPALLGQGMSLTTVEQGDVTIGLSAAVGDLSRRLSPESQGAPEELMWGRMMAASSAAGGLSMTVHGLVYDMTVRAAKEAALGAGAVVRMVTAGDITESDLSRLTSLRPKIIMLAGGVDYGERDTAVNNAKLLAGSGLKVPVIYAGNVAAQDEVRGILEASGIKVYLVDNVYPRVDELVVEPARAVIQEVFEEHITGAPGMDRIRDMVDGPIMPTPGAVMEACKMLHPVLGDLCALDIGGATTDVHSVAKGSPEIQSILESPEPLAKRTVEGDLGIHVNAANIYQQVKDEAERDLGFDPGTLLGRLQVVPTDPEMVRMLVYFSAYAARTAFGRHAGRIKYLYGPSGRQTVALGKDLSSVRTVIGTGGALTKLPGGEDTLRELVGQGPGRELYPKDAAVFLDTRYIMASCGVLSREYPDEARQILLRSLELR